jgi:large subunit ribosomal protein L21
MFAVFKTGGKQYRVSENDVFVVEKLAGEAGATLEFNEVLMIGEAGKAPQVGSPLIDKAAVFGEVVRQTRGEKLIIFKKRRRQNSQSRNGHRQDLTLIRITAISPTGAKPAATAKKAASKAEAAGEETKAAPKKAAAEKKPAAEKKASAAKPAAKKAAAKKAAPKADKE